MLNDSPECRSGCQNEEKDFFEPLCLRARNGFIGSCSTTLQSVGVAVKMKKKISLSLCAFVREMVLLVPAQRLSRVSEWLLKMIMKFPLCLANSQVSPATAGCLSARNGPAMTGRFCTGVSPANAGRVTGCPKWVNKVLKF